MLDHDLVMILCYRVSAAQLPSFLSLLLLLFVYIIHYCLVTVSASTHHAVIIAKCCREFPALMSFRCVCMCTCTHTHTHTQGCMFVAVCVCVCVYACVWKSMTQYWRSEFRCVCCYLDPGLTCNNSDTSMICNWFVTGSTNVIIFWCEWHTDVIVIWYEVQMLLLCGMKYRCYCVLWSTDVITASCLTCMNYRCYCHPVKYRC